MCKHSSALDLIIHRLIFLDIEKTDILTLSLSKLFPLLSCMDR